MENEIKFLRLKIKAFEKEESMIKLAVYFKIMPGAEDLELPSFATQGSSGIDLRACINKSMILHSGDRVIVPTGIAIALPMNYEAQVRPRSGLAFDHGITVLNTPGTIDSDYRGEIKVILFNSDNGIHKFNRGDRIAQLVVQQLPQIEWVVVDKLSETKRNDGGFGHTGDK